MFRCVVGVPFYFDNEQRRFDKVTRTFCFDLWWFFVLSRHARAKMTGCCLCECVKIDFHRCTARELSYLLSTTFSLVTDCREPFANVVAAHCRCSIFRKISASVARPCFSREQCTVFLCVSRAFLPFVSSLLAAVWNISKVPRLRVECSIYSYRAYDTDTAEKSISSACQVPAEFLPCYRVFLCCRFAANLMHQYYLALESKTSSRAVLTEFPVTL